MGNFGSIFDVSIPNNITPSKPDFEADILLQREVDDSWRNKGMGAVKSSATEHLLRILLSEDFMTEGKNKLGIVVRRNASLENDNRMSVFGEDITKLTDADWSGDNFRDLVRFTGVHNCYTMGYYLDCKTQTSELPLPLGLTVWDSAFSILQ